MNIPISWKQWDLRPQHIFILLISDLNTSQPIQKRKTMTEGLRSKDLLNPWSFHGKRALWTQVIIGLTTPPPLSKKEHPIQKRRLMFKLLKKSFQGRNCAMYVNHAHCFCYFAIKRPQRRVYTCGRTCWCEKLPHSEAQQIVSRCPW